MSSESAAPGPAAGAGDEGDELGAHDHHRPALRRSPTLNPCHIDEGDFEQALEPAAKRTRRTGSSSGSDRTHSAGPSPQQQEQPATVAVTVPNFILTTPACANSCAFCNATTTSGRVRCCGGDIAAFGLPLHSPLHHDNKQCSGCPPAGIAGAGAGAGRCPRLSPAAPSSTPTCATSECRRPLTRHRCASALPRPPTSCLCTHALPPQTRARRCGLRFKHGRLGLAPYTKLKGGGTNNSNAAGGKAAPPLPLPPLGGLGVLDFCSAALGAGEDFLPLPSPPHAASGPAQLHGGPAHHPAAGLLATWLQLMPQQHLAAGADHTHPMGDPHAAVVLAPPSPLLLPASTNPFAAGLDGPHPLAHHHPPGFFAPPSGPSSGAAGGGSATSEGQLAALLQHRAPPWLSSRVAAAPLPPQAGKPAASCDGGAHAASGGGGAAQLLGGAAAAVAGISGGGAPRAATPAAGAVSRTLSPATSGARSSHSVGSMRVEAAGGGASAAAATTGAASPGGQRPSGAAGGGAGAGAWPAGPPAARRVTADPAPAHGGAKPGGADALASGHTGLRSAAATMAAAGAQAPLAGGGGGGGALDPASLPRTASMAVAAAALLDIRR